MKGKELSYKTICLTNVGGAGMSALAGFYAQKGIKVYGVEKCETPYLKPLRALGISIHNEFYPAMLPDNSLLVISSATKKNHPAYVYAKKHNRPILHRSTALAEINLDFQTICVSGSHGKSTVTAFLFDAFHKTDKPISVLTGAFIRSIGQNYFYTDKTPYLICECDESDGSIERYSPNIAVITNIDDDHMEHFTSMDNLEKVFANYVSRIKEKGILVINGDDVRLQKLLKLHRHTSLTFGFSEDVLYRVSIQKSTIASVTFSLEYKKETLVERLCLPIPGHYNALNAAVPLLLAHHLGYNVHKVADNLSQTKGLSRRMDVLLHKESLPLFINEYAHHPTALQLVIDTFKNSGYRLNIVFQPHRIERLQYHMDAFAKTLQDADRVIITPVYDPKDADLSKPLHHVLYEKISPHCDAHYIDMLEDLSAKVIEMKPDKNDLFIFCNAGDLGCYAHKMVEKQYGKHLA
ncbi:MAG: Mur ligase family protein [Alphaproteobacteria bacterium]|nr:Mur ligase family protein [Alphaproteobacteria bacterium]